MGVGAFLEPLVVIVLLFGGTWINRDTQRPGYFSRQVSSDTLVEEEALLPGNDDANLLESGRASPPLKHPSVNRRSMSPSLLIQDEKQAWRTRTIGFGRWTYEVRSPNTAVFRHRFLSRVLRRFPFLVECWYWALVYWTYQLGRAFTALTLKGDTVDVAREHALQLIRIEQALGIFVERDIQEFFLQRPRLMQLTNWIYSFIHIPGTIAFLVWLYYYTTTRNSWDLLSTRMHGSPAGPPLYAARRRTLAVCNLLAFIVFTLWPCMPPRLLSDPDVEGPVGDLSRSYGFVDTVHGANGASSIWTQNRFCNQYAAMPSLHFGYSLMIGLTILTIPLPREHRRSKTLVVPRLHLRISLPSWRRSACVAVGVAYPLIILAAIIATANHFILDAVAGALVCAVGWHANRILLNLLPLEDYFLWALRLHKPVRPMVELPKPGDDSSDADSIDRAVVIS